MHDDDGPPNRGPSPPAGPASARERARDLPRLVVLMLTTATAMGAGLYLFGFATTAIAGIDDSFFGFDRLVVSLLALLVILAGMAGVVGRRIVERIEPRRLAFIAFFGLAIVMFAIGGLSAPALALACGAILGGLLDIGGSEGPSGTGFANRGARRPCD